MHAKLWFTSKDIQKTNISLGRSVNFSLNELYLTKGFLYWTSKDFLYWTSNLNFVTCSCSEEPALSGSSLFSALTLVGILSSTNQRAGGNLSPCSFVVFFTESLNHSEPCDYVTACNSSKMSTTIVILKKYL